MLKKLLMLLLALLLGMTAVLAEELDLTKMTYDELAALRLKVNAEIQGRPEAEPITLGNGGMYIVGQDLKPGTYYFIYDDSISGAAFVEVYQDETMQETLLRLFVTSDKYAVFALPNLKEGNCIVPGFTIKLSSAGFPEYTAPEGVLVPPGVYEIGTDIPAGRYNIFLNEGGCRVEVYESQEVYDNAPNYLSADYWLNLNARVHSGVATMKEGNILVINDESVIMTKYVPAFNFD